MEQSKPMSICLTKAEQRLPTSNVGPGPGVSAGAADVLAGLAANAEVKVDVGADGSITVTVFGAGSGFAGFGVMIL